MMYIVQLKKYKNTVGSFEEKKGTNLKNCYETAYRRQLFRFQDSRLKNCDMLSSRASINLV